MTQFPGPEDQPNQPNQPPSYGAPPPAYGSAPTPSGGYGTGGGTPPPNYLVWAILSTIFCCLPLGIASIVFAAQVNSKWSAGDAAGAQDASEKAKKFAIWSAIAGVVVAVLYILLFVVIGVAGRNS